MKLFCDNKVTISIANNSNQHDRTKHVEIDRHFIKERLDNGFPQAIKLLIFSLSGFSDEILILALAS